MENRKFVLCVLSTLLLAVLALGSLGVASATDLVLEKNNDPIVIQPGSSVELSFNITNINDTRTYNSIIWSQSATNKGTLTLPTLSEIGPGETILLKATLSVPSSETGTVSVSIVANDTGKNVISNTLQYTLNIPNMPKVGINPATQTVDFGKNATIRIVNLGNVNLDNLVISEITNFGVNLSTSTINFLPRGETSDPITVILTGLQNIRFGNNDVRLQVNGSGVSSTGTITVQKSFCANGQVGNNISISKVRIENKGDGDDDKWEFLDEIEVEVKVNNDNLDEDIDAIVVLGIYDSTGTDIADEMMFLDSSDSSDEEIELSIDSNDDATATFVFRVPADSESGSYRVAVKAYDDDLGESRSCADRSSDLNNNIFESISIREKEDKDDYIAIDDVELPSEATCGETIDVPFSVFNVGKDNEERVRIDITSPGLNLNRMFEITSDFDKGDSEDFFLSFTIPSDAEEKVHTIEFIPSYDYSSSSGEYRREGNSFKHPLEVFGCSPGSGNVPVISAFLDSQARPGEEMTVRARISNTGSSSQTFVIEASGYQSWAGTPEVNPRILSLPAGQSGESIITMMINEDAKGQQSFTITATADDGREFTQQVQVTLSDSSGPGFSLSGLFGNSNYIWWLVIVNVILVILIIAVAIKLARR